MKLLRYLSNLGYGSRRDVLAMFADARVTDAAGDQLYGDDVRAHAEVRIDGEPLDPAPGVLLMLNKPVGVTCSSKDVGKLVYSLLPPRFKLRSPIVSTVGRLDRDSSGLLLLTDDGTLLHRIISPKSKLPKVYHVKLARPLRGDEGRVFASGTLMLSLKKHRFCPQSLRHWVIAKRA